MPFKLEFKTDNAAFMNDEGDFAPGAEIARILAGIASHYDGSYSIDGPAQPVYDVNGNRIGQYRLSSL